MGWRDWKEGEDKKVLTTETFLHVTSSYKQPGMGMMIMMIIVSQTSKHETNNGYDDKDNDSLIIMMMKFEQIRVDGEHFSS